LSKYHPEDQAGGSDQEAVQAIASLFSAEGSFLFAFRDHDDQDLSSFKALAGGPIHPPMMVLTDRQTTGASELLAAVLSGNAQSAMLIGEPTAGDPLIREPLTLDENLVIYMASRKAVMENGTAYHADQTVTPHILVPRGAAKSSYEPEPSMSKSKLEEEISDRMMRDRVRNDPALNRAADLLLGLKALNIQRPGAP